MNTVISFSERSLIRQYKRNGVTPMDAVTASQHIGAEAHRIEIAEWQDKAIALRAFIASDPRWIIKADRWMHDKSQCNVYEQYALELQSNINSKGFDNVSKQTVLKTVWNKSNKSCWRERKHNRNGNESQYRLKPREKYKNYCIECASNITSQKKSRLIRRAWGGSVPPIKKSCTEKIKEERQNDDLSRLWKWRDIHYTKW